MTAILLARHLSSLRPVDEAGETLLQGLRQGEIVRAEIRRPRNVQHHRWLWALATIVAQNSTVWRNSEDVVTALKFATGHVTTFRIPGTDKVYEIPRSISFAKMDQDAFKQFSDRCIGVITERWLPGVSSEALRQEVLEMMGETT